MKLFTRMICAILALTTILSGAPAFAADAGKTASIWNERITVEGNQAYCRNEAGKETFFLSYGGAVYVPLRTAAEWLGKDLTKSGNTFTLSGSKSPVYQEQLPSSETVFGSVSTEEYWTRIKTPVPITMLSDAKLMVNGTAAALTDSTGKPVSLIDWNGEAYLPARSAAQLLGMDIKYQQYFRTDENGKKVPNGAAIYMRTKLTDAQMSACSEYVKKLNDAVEGIQNLYSSVNTESYEAADTTVSQFLAYVRVMKDTPKPDCRIFDNGYAQMQTAADEAIKACEQVKQMIQNKEDLAKIRYAIREDLSCEGYEDDDPPASARGMSSICIGPGVYAVQLINAFEEP